jgi:hypothetical protein
MVLEGQIESLLKKEQYTDVEIFKFCNDYLKMRDVYGNLRVNYFDISDEELWEGIDPEYQYSAVDIYVKGKGPTIWLFTKEPKFQNYYGDGNLWMDDASSDEEHVGFSNVYLGDKLFKDTLRERP